MDKTFALPISSDFRLEEDAVKSLCEAINSPRSLTVWLMLHYGEYDQYMGLQTDSDLYDNPSNFADDHLVTEVLKKSPNIPINANRTEAALSSFWDSELSCFYTKMRLREETFPWEHILRRRIARILGPLDCRALQEIEESFRHGPGATASLRSSGLVPSDKFEKPISLTIELYPYYKSILGPLWWEHQKNPGEIVGGSKFTTVPKNAKTDRCIAAEPTLNMYVQLGIGRYIRDRLRRFGLDLNHQDRNRLLAQRAYSEGLATIDLSAASDSISSELVLSYLPEPWVELLSLCRSHRTFVQGDWHELEKFSSMGNGYTFELETLIFYAVCASIVPREEMDRVGVYGDDIILPSQYANDLVEALNFLGFRVNQQKSFLAGNFFESCGCDFFKGKDVRPFYLKGSRPGIPYTLQIANKLRNYSRLAYDGHYCDGRFRETWLALYKRIPRLWKRCKVPPILGDTGVITSRREAKAPRAPYHNDGFLVRHIAFRAIYRAKGNIFPLISHLSHRGISENPTLGREPRRGFLGQPRPKSVIVSQWPDGLDWLT